MKKLLLSGDRDGNIGILLGRLYLGLMIMGAHGYSKVFGGMERHAGFIESKGLPLPLLLAWLSALAEFLGGILIAVGIFTRVAASVLAINLAVAAFYIHGADPLKVREFAYVYLALTLVYVFKGAGRWSLDAELR